MRGKCVNLVINAALFAAFTCLLALSSCYKDALTRRAEVLIGEWQCVSVWRYLGNDKQELLNESTIDLRFVFKEKGIFIVERDGRCIGRSKIREWSTSDDNSGLSFYFESTMVNITGRNWGLHMRSSSEFRVGLKGILGEDVSNRDEYTYDFIKIN